MDPGHVSKFSRTIFYYWQYEYWFLNYQYQRFVGKIIYLQNSYFRRNVIQILNLKRNFTQSKIGLFSLQVNVSDSVQLSWLILACLKKQISAFLDPKKVSFARTPKTSDLNFNLAIICKKTKKQHNNTCHNAALKQTSRNTREKRIYPFVYFTHFTKITGFTKKSAIPAFQVITQYR